MIDLKLLGSQAEVAKTLRPEAKARIELKPEEVLDLLNERERLIEVLKAARHCVISGVLYAGTETAVEACADIRVEE